MTLFYVGLAKNTETGFTGPVSAAVTEEEAERLLLEWLKEADRIYGKGSRVAAGTAFIRSEYCEGVAVDAEARIKTACVEHRKQYLESLHSLKAAIEREIKDFQRKPLSTPSASIEVEAGTVAKESYLLRLAIEALESIQEK